MQKDSIAYQSFGERFKKAMELSGMNQTQLAEACGMNVANINNYCRGERIPHPILADKICRVLGVPIDWLLRGKPRYVLFKIEDGECEEWGEYQFDEIRRMATDIWRFGRMGVQIEIEEVGV